MAELDVSSYPQGLYLVRIISTQGTETRKLIIH
jgi:hypothetical protein